MQLHKFDDDLFNRRIQLSELEYLVSSDVAQAAFVENYVGLPFEKFE